MSECKGRSGSPTADVPMTSDSPSRDVVTRTGASGYRTWIDVAGHEFHADEPVHVGGGNSGPDPYGLLLAGLGACTGMTLRMYATRKGWPLEDVVVRLRQARNHAQDCENCHLPESRLAGIEREIELSGPLAPEQRTRLLQIAEQCPVHRSLKQGFDIRTRLVEG